MFPFASRLAGHRGASHLRRRQWAEAPVTQPVTPFVGCGVVAGVHVDLYGTHHPGQHGVKIIRLHVMAIEPDGSGCRLVDAHKITIAGYQPIQFHFFARRVSASFL